MNTLNAESKNSSIDEIAQDCTYIFASERGKLKSLLCKHESLFEGTLGEWKTKPVHWT